MKNFTNNTITHDRIEQGTGYEKIQMINGKPNKAK